MKYIYLAILFFSILGVFTLDLRFKLVFYDNPKPAARSIAIMMAILLFVDVVGINWGIFATNPYFVTGLFLGSPNLPIEEILFLFLLCYSVLSIYILITRSRSKRGGDV